MAFTIYSSNDSGAPAMSGASGSLLTVLDAVLVTGYGSKPGAGWSKPLPNTGSYGIYRQGTGSMFYLFVNDGSGSSGGAEAVLSGWDSITAITAGAVTGSNPFPTYTQLSFGGGAGGGSGGVILRKSSVITAVSRTWTIMADSRSLYIFTKPTDNGQFVSAAAFGDFYSLRSGSADTSNCLIIGRTSVSSSATSVERLDSLSTTNLANAITGHFCAHIAAGTGGSITLSKHGDGIKGANSGVLNGTVTYLNGVDNGLYLSPIWIVENSTNTIRGRMRGLWHVCHASSSFTDGQTFTGSNDFQGRTFQVIAPSGNSGVYFMETSDTLETN
jgi:hypothetical protein